MHLWPCGRIDAARPLLETPEGEIGRRPLVFLQIPFLPQGCPSCGEACCTERGTGTAICKTRGLRLLFVAPCSSRLPRRCWHHPRHGGWAPGWPPPSGRAAASDLLTIIGCFLRSHRRPLEFWVSTTCFIAMVALLHTQLGVPGNA